MKEERITPKNLKKVISQTLKFLRGKKFAISTVKREQGNINFLLKPSQKLKSFGKAPAVRIEKCEESKNIGIFEISTSAEIFRFPIFEESSKNPLVVFNEDSVVFSLINCLGRQEYFGFAPEL